MNPYQKPSIDSMLESHRKYMEWVEDNPRNKRIDDAVQKVLDDQDRNLNGDVNVTVDTVQNTFTDTEVAKIIEIKRQIFSVYEKIVWPDYFVIAGGAFVSLFHGESVKDYDVFFLADPTRPDLHKIILDNLQKAYPGLIDNTHIYGRDNENITGVHDAYNQKIQFIFTKFTKREEVIANFDYVHCMASFQKGKLYITRSIFDAVRDKKLIVNNTDRIRSRRQEKFAKRGWWPIKTTVPAPSINTSVHSGSMKITAMNARVNPMGKGGNLAMAQAEIDKEIKKLIEDLERDGQ